MSTADRRWDPPASHVLPVGLRVLFGKERLPPDIQTALRLPEGARLADLGTADPSTWESNPAARQALIRFVQGLLKRHRKQIKDIRIWGDRWPDGLGLDDLALTNRTHNAIGRAQLERKLGTTLGILTYGKAYAFNGVGCVGLLELAVAGDQAIDWWMSCAGELRARIASIRDEDWHRLVSSADPRFAELQPLPPGTVAELLDGLRNKPLNARVAEQLLAMLPAVSDRARVIAAMSLEACMRHLAEHCTSYRGHKLDALLSRLGWTGKPPITLKEAGARAGVASSAIGRQEWKVRRRKLPRHPFLLPAAARALRALAAAAPLAVSQAEALLVADGITEAPFALENVLAIAELARLPVPVRIEDDAGTKRVVTRPYGLPAST